MFLKKYEQQQINNKFTFILFCRNIKNDTKIIFSVIFSAVCSLIQSEVSHTAVVEY